jgi:hypothetical protein
VIRQAEGEESPTNQLFLSYSARKKRKTPYFFTPSSSKVFKTGVKK